MPRTGILGIFRAYVSDLEHGTRQNGCAVCHINSPKIEDGKACYIIRIN